VVPGFEPIGAKIEEEISKEAMPKESEMTPIKQVLD